MSWFDRHIDQLLESWALGELSSAQASRMLRHAHSCTRCGRLYEQWVKAHRMLESRHLDLPTPAEHAALMASGLDAALTAATPPLVRGRWPALMALLGAVATVCVVLLVTRVPALSGMAEWQSRGVGMPAPGAVLRLFCATPDRPLRELGPVDTCPPGAQLAFAAGAESPLSHVAVLAYMVPPRLVEPGQTQTVSLSSEKTQRPEEPRPQVTPRPYTEPWRQKGGPFLVGGRPAQEVPLEWTLRLPSTHGEEVVVEAAFASGPEAALQSLLARGSEAKGVMRRQSVRLQEDP